MKSTQIDELVVITAANRWEDHRMADRQLAEALAHDCRVLYVDPPASRRARDMRAEDDHIYVLRPARLPWMNVPLSAFISRYVIARQIRRSVRSLRAARTLLIEANVNSPVVGLLGEQRSVYWAQDDWSGLAAIVGLNAAILRRNERRLTMRSSAVIAANPLNGERLSSTRADVRVVPFGASTGLFEGAVTADDPGGDPGCAVLMGTLNSRIDFALLGYVVRRGVPLLIIGPITDDIARDALEELRGLGDVEHREEVPFTEMPRLLARCAVGLVPYGHSPFNDGSFPLKTLEYLAAGLPVVATDLPAIRWLNSDEIRVADDPAAYGMAVAELVGRGRPLPSDRRRRQAFARSHDWQTRAAEFRSALAVTERAS